MSESPWVPDPELCVDLDCTRRTLRRIKAKGLIPLVEVVRRSTGRFVRRMPASLT